MIIQYILGAHIINKENKVAEREQRRNQVTNQIQIQGLVTRVFDRYNPSLGAYLIQFYTKYPFARGGSVNETFTKSTYLVKTKAGDPDEGSIVKLTGVLNFHNDKAYIYETNREFVRMTQKKQEKAPAPQPEPDQSSDDFEFGGGEIPF